MTTLNPLGRGVLAQDRFGDGSSLGLRPLTQAMGLTYTISASKYSVAMGLTYTIQKANTASMLLYYVISPLAQFALNGDASIISPDKVTYTPRTVTARTLSANPLLQGYTQMTWTYSKLQLAEYQHLLSFYNPQATVVLVTYPDDNGTWQQQNLVMHPPQYGSQTTVIFNDVALIFTRMF